MNKITSHLYMCRKRLKWGVSWDDDGSWLVKRFRSGGREWEVRVGLDSRTAVWVDRNIIFDGHLEMALIAFGGK